MHNNCKIIFGHKSVISSNTSKAHVQDVLSLARKSTSVSCVQESKTSVAIRRCDLKSLIYLNNTINNDGETPNKLKSCLYTQKQCDKVKMKVKFYLKKRDYNLHVMSQAKSAHCFKKYKGITSDTYKKHKNNVSKLANRQSYLNMQQNRMKLSEKYMAGDNSFEQSKVKSAKYAKESLTRKIRNMIIEKTKQLSDTSLSLCEKSLKSKYSTSYSSIIKYHVFKRKLRKDDLRNQILNQKLSQNKITKPDVIIEKKKAHSVKKETNERNITNVSVNHSTHRGFQRHLERNLTNPTRAIDPKSNICYDTCTTAPSYKSKRDLAAFFHRDIGITGKKLTLWAKRQQRKYNKGYEDNSRNQGKSYPDVNDQSVKRKKKNKNSPRNSQLKRHRNTPNKLKRFEKLTVNENKEILPRREDGVEANLYSHSKMGSRCSENKSRLSMEQSINTNINREFLTRELVPTKSIHLNKKYTKEKVYLIPDSHKIQNKSHSKDLAYSLRVNSINELCFELLGSHSTTRNENCQPRNFRNQTKPTIQESIEHPSLQKNATKYNYQTCFNREYKIQPVASIKKKPSQLICPKSKIENDRTFKIYRTPALLRKNLNRQCSKIDLSCLTLTLLNTEDSRGIKKPKSTRGNFFSNKGIICKAFFDCVNKFWNKETKLSNKMGTARKSYSGEQIQGRVIVDEMQAPVCNTINNNELAKRTYNDNDYMYDDLTRKHNAENGKDNEERQDLTKFSDDNTTKGSKTYNDTKNIENHRLTESSNDVLSLQKSVCKSHSELFKTAKKEIKKIRSIMGDYFYAKVSDDNKLSNRAKNKLDRGLANRNYDDLTTKNYCKCIVQKNKTKSIPKPETYRKNLDKAERDSWSGDSDLIDLAINRTERYDDNRKTRLRPQIERYGRNESDCGIEAEDVDHDSANTRSKTNKKTKLSPEYKRYCRSKTYCVFGSEDSNDDLENRNEKNSDYRKIKLSSKTVRNGRNEPEDFDHDLANRNERNNANKKLKSKTKKYCSCDRDCGFEPEDSDDDLASRTKNYNDNRKAMLSPRTKRYSISKIDRGFKSKDSDDDLTNRNEKKDDDRTRLRFKIKRYYRSKTGCDFESEDSVTILTNRNERNNNDRKTSLSPKLRRNCRCKTDHGFKFEDSDDDLSNITERKINDRKTRLSPKIQRYCRSKTDHYFESEDSDNVLVNRNERNNNDRKTNLSPKIRRNCRCKTDGGFESEHSDDDLANRNEIYNDNRKTRLSPKCKKYNRNQTGSGLLYENSDYVLPNRTEKKMNLKTERHGINETDYCSSYRESDDDLPNRNDYVETRLKPKTGRQTKRYCKNETDNDYASRDFNYKTANRIKKNEYNDDVKTILEPESERYRKNKTYYDNASKDSYNNSANRTKKHNYNKKQKIITKPNPEMKTGYNSRTGDLDEDVLDTIMNKPKRLCHCKSGIFSKNLHDFDDNELREKVVLYKNLKKELEEELSNRYERNQNKKYLYRTAGVIKSGIKLKKYPENYASNITDFNNKSYDSYRLDPDKLRFELNKYKAKLERMMYKCMELDSLEKDSQLINSEERKENSLKCESCLEWKRCTFLDDQKYLCNAKQKQGDEAAKNKRRKIALRGACHNLYRATAHHKYMFKDISAQSITKGPSCTVHRIFPCLYPYFINCTQQTKQAINLCLYGVSIACCSPFLFLLSLILYVCQNK